METLPPPFDRFEVWIAMGVGLIVLLSLVSAIVKKARCLIQIVLAGVVLGIVLLAVVLWMNQ